tara:strand:- start:437 stop:2122 length:1686 start_codon:yes stop_codon:yes gene_type:complete
MSGFFYDQMAEKVVEEGEMYGAANPITIEELQKAQQTGEDPTDRLGYGLKGKAARGAAFSGLSSEIQLQASRDYAEFISNAQRQELDPEEVIDGLDSITLGYTSMLKEISPKEHLALKGNLSQITSGHFKGYMTELIKSEQNKEKSLAAVEITGIKNNIPTQIKNIILTPGLTEKEYKEKLLAQGAYSKGNGVVIAIQKGKYTPLQIQTLEKNYDTELLNSYKSEIISTALKTGTVANYTSAITQGQKTKNAQIDAMLSLMDTEDRLDLIKDMRQAREDEISFANAIDDKDEEVTKTKFNEAMLLANDGIDENDEEKFESGLAIMKAINPESDEVFKIQREYKLFRGKKRLSDSNILLDLKEKAQRNILDFKELNKKRSDLNSKDYKDLFEEVERDKDDIIQEALSEVPEIRAIALNKLPVVDINSKENILYTRLLGGLKNAQAIAQNKLEAFDAKEWVKTNIKIQNQEILDEIKDKQKKSFSNTLNIIKKEFKNRKIDYDALFKQVEKDTLQEYEDVLEYLNNSTDKKIEKLVKILANDNFKVPSLLEELNIYKKDFGDE